MPNNIYKIQDVKQYPLNTGWGIISTGYWMGNSINGYCIDLRWLAIMFRWDGKEKKSTVHWKHIFYDYFYLFFNIWERNKHCLKKVFHQSSVKRSLCPYRVQRPPSQEALSQPPRWHQFLDGPFHILYPHTIMYWYVRHRTASIS